jgi:hypothetical protein
MSTHIRAVAVAIPALCCLSLFPAYSLAQAAKIRDCLQLTVKDHTSVVYAIQGKLAPITELARKQNIDVLARSPQTAQSLLTSVAKSQILDSETNRKLELAAACLLLTPASSIAASSRAAIKEVALELNRANSVPNAIERLASLQKKYTDVNELREAITVASAVLKDGQQTIYSEKEQVFQTLASSSAEQPLTKAKSANEYAVDLAAADGKGAVNGAVGGCVAGLLAGGVGCGPGALLGGVAAGIGNSAQELVEQAWKQAK